MKLNSYEPVYLPQHQRTKPDRKNLRPWITPCVYYSRGRFVVTTLPGVRCKMVDPTNQHQHQKQQDSEAMFLMFLARMKSSVWRRLLHSSTWRRYDIKSRLTHRYRCKSIEALYIPRFNWVENSNGNSQNDLPMISTKVSIRYRAFHVPR